MKDEYWIKKTTKKEIKDKRNWAKLRIKNDKKTGKDYIDVLVGAKGNPWHAHIGWNLDHTILFTEFRDITKSIERKVVSKKFGPIDDKKVVVDSTIDPVKTVVMESKIEGSTKEVSIERFEFE